MTLTAILQILTITLLIGLIITGIKIMLNFSQAVVRLEAVTNRLQDAKPKILAALDNQAPDALIDRMMVAIENAENVETAVTVGLDRTAKGLPAIPVEGQP
jgi:hypothetical protein